MKILTFDPKKETFLLEKNLDLSIMNNERETKSAWWNILTEEEKTRYILKALE